MVPPIDEDNAPTRVDGPGIRGDESTLEVEEGGDGRGNLRGRSGAINGDPLGAQQSDLSIPSAADSLERSSLGSREWSMTARHETMLLQDSERTRSFLRLAALISFVLMLPLPLLPGGSYAKWLFAGGMLATGLACLTLERSLREPSAYAIKRLLPYAFVCLLGAFSGINYFGVFSPAVVVLPFGLYFFGLAQSFRETLTIYLASAAAYLGLAFPIVVGLVDDHGLIRASELHVSGQLVVIAAVQVVLVATYATARFSRRATEHGLERHDRVVRELAGRDALLLEARMDLERVLRARGLGRFTGEIVGQYKLGQILGRGGMGEVYEAIHLDTEEQAALKLLHPHVLEDAENVERFFRECRSTMALEGANVVRVLNTSEPMATIPFIAMERLYGNDLAEILRNEGSLKMREMIGLIREVGGGLDAARRAGIVHRDIKPRNIFHADVVAGNRTKIWKILDFGVSKLVNEVTMTHHHLVGTPSYMAPEQASGEEVSHRTDLFSLGVVTYRALTGRPAFTGGTSATVIYRVINEMPPKPSEVARLSEEVDQVLALALAKDPWERFDSAAEFADALEKAARNRLPAALKERAQRVLSKHAWPE